MMRIDDEWRTSVEDFSGGLQWRTSMEDFNGGQLIPSELYTGAV